MSSNSHRWQFFRSGGFDQVTLQSGADLLALDQLDQKLWVALACPTRGVEFDIRTLDLIDTDKDGRIRAPEIIAATQWACRLLKNPDVLLNGSPTLLLSSINDSSPEGRQLLASARQILLNLGKGESDGITAEDTADTVKIFAQTKFNGDGIIPAEAASDEQLQLIIEEIIQLLGPETDRSGKPGVNQAKVDQFFAEAAAYSDWWKRAENDAATTLLLGEATASAAAALQHVRTKVEDYFARCRLAAFDGRALAALNRQESEYLSLTAKDLSISASEVSSFPLARIEAGKPLPLKEGVNPAWAAAVLRLHAEVVVPLLGDKPILTESEWNGLVKKFSAYEGWSAGKAGAAVEKLGLKRLRAILASPAHRQISDLIARDKALEPEANAIAAVDKLVRLHRDLFKLLNNFVAFRDFYRRRDKAIFQAGTLFLDQRSCELCVTVSDPAKHATLAGLAKTYLAYCDCTRPGGEKMTIAAAFTDGDSDNLMVGRNGIFYDRKGRDWDATITRVVDNPISLHQAFWTPYKKFVRFIEEFAAKRAATAEASTAAKLQTAAAQATGEKPPAKPEPRRFDVGVVAALGVALGALGTVFGGFVAGFLKLAWWQMPLAVLGLVLVISFPSMAIAWLKLHQRNLGPILDANGWAVNARAKLNIPFGRSLTGVRTLPPGSQRDLFDPYEARKNFWPVLLVLLLLLGAVGYYVYKMRTPAPIPAEQKPSTISAPTNAP